MSPTATETRPATQPIPKNDLEPEIEKAEGWSTLKAPELFSFERPGQEIVGTLTDISVVEVQHKKVLQYILMFGDQKIKLLGTYDLVQKLTRAHLGRMVRIKYRGTDPTITKNGNAMKVFHVIIKDAEPNAPPMRESSPITDEDIPF
jgi:hypothetical protein